jgi:RHS repeat-associated protein
VTASYDSSGRLQSVTNPERAGSSPTDGSDTYTYDGLGRILSVSHSAGGSVQTYYGANVTTVGGNTTQLCASATYGLGYPTLVVDEAGKKREVWTDGFGRPVEVDEPNNSGALSQNTCYSYDVLNNLIGVTQGTQTRSYGYDKSSRLVVAATPESGTVNYYYTTSGSALCSGNPGAVCRRADARGLTTNYSYDTLNRLTGITYAGGSPATPPVTYSYDAGTNQKGFRTGMTDGSGSTAWTYNSDDWILSEQRTNAGKVHTISYSYNQDGTIAAIVYPSGRTITYTTNNAERATSAKDVANGIQYAVTASYAPIGALTAVVYGQATGFTGIAQSASYNSRLETTAVSASSTAGTPENLAFNYGTSANNGSLVSIQNNVIPGLGASFTYDSLNRIVSGATTSSTAPGCWGQSFGTAGNPPDDQWSNLTQINSTQCSAGTLNVGVTSSTNRLSATGYAFDAAGNMTADSLYTYTYDAENHLMQATGMSGGPWTYTYDGNGLRAEKSSPSGGTLYWRSTKGGTIAESDLSGNITNEYVLFAGKRVAQRTGAGNSVYYYYLDQIGNTIAITTQTGTPCYQATFAPYGQEYATQATCSTNYKFTGYERDSETGLDYAFARYYNSRLARFMSADPVAGSTADPQTWNRYAYVGNNPPNRRDPLGLFVHDCSWTGTCMGFAPGPSGSGGGGCSVDGVEGSCGGALGLNGTAACPNNQCQLFYNGQYYAFQAFADGSSGYLSSQAPPGWSPSDIAHAFTIVSEGQGTPIDPSTLTGQAAAAYDALAAIVNQEDITIYQTGSESFEAVLTDAGFDQLEQSDVNFGFWDAALHYPYTDGGRDDNTTNSLHFVWFDENLTNAVGGSGVYMQFHVDSFNPEAGGFGGHARCVLFHIGC